MPMHPLAEFVEVRSVDAHLTQVRVLRAADPVAPVIVCLPALGIDAARYDRLVELLRHTGWNVVVSDLRGFGRSSVRSARDNDFGYAQMVHRDLPALIKVVRQLFPSSPRVLFGHGLGGELWSLFLSVHPGAAVGMVTVGSANGHYLGWPLPARVGLLAKALALQSLGALLGHVPASLLGISANAARTVIRDWSNNCLSGHYCPANDRSHYEVALEQLRKPMLMISLEGDRLAPRDAVDGLATKMFRSSPWRRHLSAQALGVARSDRTSWLQHPAAIVQLLEDWFPYAVRPVTLTRTTKTHLRVVRSTVA